MAEGQACRDFGSFHASNVQELLALPEEKYHPPSLPFTLPSFDQYCESKIQFGKTCRKQHFLLKEDCTFLNHGAFGAALSQALLAAQQWQQCVERQPLQFFDRELLPHLVYITRRLAKFVGCDPLDLALVLNATTGINCVLRSLKFAHGDVIVCLNVTYGAVKKILRQVCEDTGAMLREVPITFPVHGEHQVVEAVKCAIAEGDVKLAVLDHVPSNTPILLPLDEIIQLCHQHGVQVLVDGAHALGALPLNLKQLDPDYYVSNAHKWFCNPKGAAFLFVRRELQKYIHPLTISHGYGSGFNSEFMWAGLHDYSPFLALHTVLDFWQAVGPDRIRLYIEHMAKYAAEVLTSTWKTQLAAPLSLFGSMILVELPQGLCPMGQEVDYVAAERIQNMLYHRFNIEVPIKAVQGRLYVRVSVHIHNSEDDIQTLAMAVSKLLTSISL
ncbi:hypothetical protein BaRGS_00014220 [Batillaria attramentaria]|uniref:Aminotransferase class V domain-containing protein n=1 Tax=Batillaria attramentaria TaxID=370345 RepID=A0ABD0L575_9CAEN